MKQSKYEKNAELSIIVFGLITVICLLLNIALTQISSKTYQSTVKTEVEAINSLESLISYGYQYQAILYREKYEQNDSEDYSEELDNIQLQMEQTYQNLKRNEAITRLGKEEQVDLIVSYINVITEEDSGNTEYRLSEVTKMNNKAAQLISIVQTSVNDKMSGVTKLQSVATATNVAAVVIILIAYLATLAKAHGYMEGFRKEKDSEVYDDGLTGLHNQKYAKAVLPGITDGKHNGYLVMFDMDNFKQVNDTFGHDEGDRVLIGFADVLRNTLRSNDIACRLGGDEFLVYLAGVNSQDVVEQIIGRIRTNVKRAFTGTNREIITLSCGAAQLSAAGHEATLKKADEALYYVKNHGKNNFCIR